MMVRQGKTCLDSFPGGLLQVGSELEITSGAAFLGAKMLVETSKGMAGFDDNGRQKDGNFIGRVHLHSNLLKHYIVNAVSDTLKKLTDCTLSDTLTLLVERDSS